MLLFVRGERAGSRDFVLAASEVFRESPCFMPERGLPWARGSHELRTRNFWGTGPGEGVEVRKKDFRLGIALAIALVSISARPTHAYYFNFSDDAETNGERGQTSFVFTDVDGSGIDMTVTARDLTDGLGTSEGGVPNPYLDGNLNGRPGGLGVCQGNDPACSGSPDDNLGVGSGLGEVVILAFSTSVVVTEFTFRNGIHKLIFTGSVGINVGPSNPITAETFSDVFAAGAVLNPSLAGSRFSLVAEESFVGAVPGDPSRLYLESVTFVPEPGTGLLLGLGLSLLWGWQRGCASRPG